MTILCSSCSMTGIYVVQRSGFEEHPGENGRELPLAAKCGLCRYRAAGKRPVGDQILYGDAKDLEQSVYAATLPRLLPRSTTRVSCYGTTRLSCRAYKPRGQSSRQLPRRLRVGSVPSG